MTSGTTRRETLISLSTSLREQALRSVMFHAAVAARLRMSVTDFNCLNILSMDGARTPGELAHRLGITRGGGVTAMIDRLERAGFVQRRRDSTDRRRVSVSLVEDVAQESIAPMFRELGAMLADYFDTYTDDELRLLVRFTADVDAIVRSATDALRSRDLRN